MSTKRSRVHPEFKTKYRVENWTEYDRALARRGDLTVRVSGEAVAAWTLQASGRRGTQPKYFAVEAALLNSILNLTGLQLNAPGGQWRSK